MKGGFGDRHWKSIRKEWDLIKTKVSFAMEDGRRVKVLVDRWCREEHLHVSFPTLYALVVE